MRSLLLAEYDGVAPSNGSRDERIGTQGQTSTGAGQCRRPERWLSG